jgi:hypothetical protein
VRRGIALVVAAACSKSSPTPIHELRFRGEGLVVAAAPDGGAVVAGSFAVRTDLGAGELVTGDENVHGVVAWIDHDGRVSWDAMIDAPFVHGLATDGADVMLVAEAGPANRAWRLGPGGGEKWSVAFGGAVPRASAWSDGTLYVVGNFGSSDPTTGALGLAPADGRTAWVAAIDGRGQVQWAKLLDKTADLRFAEGVAVAGDRAYVITTVAQDAILDVFDRAGAQVATRKLQDLGSAPSIAPLGDGVVIMDRSGRLLALDRALATRWQHGPSMLGDAIATSDRGIFVAGAAGHIEWNGVTYPDPADGELDAFVARMSLDGEPDWISVGRSKGAASTRALAASGDVVWAAGAFMEPIVFGVADPLPGERDGIQSGFVVELKQTR